MSGIYDWDTMHGAGSFWAMGAMMGGWLLLAALTIGLILWSLLRTTSSRPSEIKSDQTARQILAERYARGELDTDEYHQRVAALR